jgi:vitamin B12/bleomycin/antimicrobial peptide transport system ATP-binding/permease protein
MSSFRFLEYHAAARRSIGPGHVFFRFWRCASGFWRGDSATTIWALTTFLVAVVLLGLLTQYWLNVWNRDFFNALERKDGPAIGEQALLFVPLALGGVALAILGVWGRMTAQRKWREWLSCHLIEHWLGNDRYRRLALQADDTQNPEYRIAEDARVATDAPIDFAVGLLTSLLTALTFIGVLWTVGGDLRTHAFGHSLTFPGYLVIAAVVYAAITTGGMLIIGRRLVRVFEGKNQAEAELRGAATRLRENALQVNNLEDRGALQASLKHVIERWRDLCRQLLQTTLISHGNSLLAPVVALTLCAPKYLAGTMSLGEVTQAAAAFVTVQAAFNWLVDNYPRLADWASSANRVGALLALLDGLDCHASTERPAGTPPSR